ncbi:MAG: hypothetical protein J5985_00900 [Kiritimatiellae bacterium]|nr:hypothetical protein [Kiritimatiellia bacterium]
MIDPWIAKVRSHRRTILGAALLLLAAGLLAAPFVAFDPSLTRLFPKDNGAGRSLALLARSSLAGKILFSFSSPVPFEDTAHREIDRFMQQVEALPHLSRTAGEGAVSGRPEDLARLAADLPALLPPTVLNKADLSDAGIRAALHKNYLRLLKPEGTFFAPLIASDPLGLLDGYLASFRRLSEWTSAGIRLDAAGRLVSEDGKNRLEVVETDIPPSDRVGSAGLVASLRQLPKELPGGITLRLAAAHFHTVSNEQITKRDLTRLTVLSTVALLAVFFLFFRDLRVLVVPLVPAVAVGLAIPATAAFTGSLSFLVPAFAPILVGLSVDYGMHLYLALRKGRPVSPLLFPVFAGLATTLAVFSAFAFGCVPGFRQLALFAGVSLVFAFLGALFLLPLLVAGGVAGGSAPALRDCHQHQTALRDYRPSSLAVWVSFVLLLGGEFAVLRHLPVRLALADLDGTEAEVRRDENAVRACWQGARPSTPMLAVEASDLDAAVAREVRVKAALPQDVRDAATGYSDLFPTPAQRRTRQSAWTSFWRVRAEDLQRSLSAASAAYGFDKAAFAPFLALVSTNAFADTLPPLLQRVEPFFRQTTETGGVATLLHLSRELTPEERRDAERDTHVQYFSPDGMEKELREFFTDEARRIGLAALCLLVVVSLALLRGLTRTLFVLRPALAGLFGILFGAFVCGITLNLIHLIVSLLVLGICFDYGVFADTAVRRGADREASRSITLCWLTTTAGTAPLLAGNHPVIRAIGFTLVVGTTAGWLAAVYPLFHRRILARLRGARYAAVVALACALLTGCRAPAPEIRLPLDAARIVAPYGKSTPNGRVGYSSVVSFAIRGHRFLSLCETEVTGKRFVSVGMTPTGITLFRIRGDETGAVCEFLAEPLAKLHSKLGAWIAEDLATLFLRPVSKGPKQVTATTFTTVDGTLYPLSLRLENRRIGYTIDVENKRIEQAKNR